MIFVLFFWIFPFSLGDPYSFEWNSGNFDYTCSGLGSDWILAGESCFYPYTLGQFNFSAAGTFCRNADLHFSVPVVVDNWLVAGSLRYRVPPNLYWTGVSMVNETAVFMNPLQLAESTYNPLWAADQPPINRNKSNCVALDVSTPESVGWRLVECSRPLAVICETFACLPNTFRCKDNSRCIPVNATHDHISDCQDGSDEDPLVISRAPAQTDCRHVLLKGSGEFVSPNFPSGYPAGTSCQWDVEAYPNRVISYTIDGYSPDLTVVGDGQVVTIPADRDRFSSVTTSRFLSFRLISPHAGSGFRVKFYSTEPNPCLLQDGIAIYDSFSMPFDCTFSAVAPVSNQFLLFLVEDIQKSPSASVNVTGAGYSFGFTGPRHSQAVVIPAGEASLTVRDAWKTSSLTSFRIRVIPIGSTCLVIPLTSRGLSLHWPCQPSPTFVPHCLSFAVIGNQGHTWRIDSLQSSSLDQVSLTMKHNEMAVTSPCSYRGHETITLGIRQLSANFSISFKVSKDCDWPSGSYSWGSEVACVDGSRAQSSECQLGGMWSVDPSVCLAVADDSQPDICVLPTMQYAYPVSPISYKVGGILSFRCMPTFFAYDDSPCINGVCSSVCQEDGTWSGHTDCNTQNTCPLPEAHNGATPIRSNSYKYGKVINYTAPVGMLDATAFSVCMDGDSAYSPEWQYYGFKFIKPLCFPFSLDFGTFDQSAYDNGTTATITCVSGYQVNGSTTCTEGFWSNTNISCILEVASSDPCLPHGQLVVNGSVWLCSCSPGYDAAGNPNAQYCRPWDPCMEGTAICDDGAVCINTSTDVERSYTCRCPPDTVLYNGPTNNTYGLIQNVTCVSPCKINDILAPLASSHFIHGYQDPPRNTTFSLYCSTWSQGLGGNLTYIKRPTETCQDILNSINNGSFKNICDTTCDSTYYVNYPTQTSPDAAGIFSTVNVYCANSSQFLIGSNSLVCSPNGNFFNNPFAPVCSFKSCSALDVFVPGLSNSTSYIVGTTIDTGCNPPYLTCILPSGEVYPRWDKNYISCTSPTPGYPSTFSSRTHPFEGSSTSFIPPGWASTGSPNHKNSNENQNSNENINVRVKRAVSCRDDINYCSNGRCNPNSGDCDCHRGFYFNRSSMQCEVDMRYYWCSSEGVRTSNGSCNCNGNSIERYGQGRYNDSPYCVDGPSCPPCSIGACTFIGATNQDTVSQSCISVFKNALTIDGQTPSNGRCPCQNGGYCMGLAPNTLPCKCPVAWVGESCETSAACQGMTCRNGGICFKGNCTCPTGWTGDRCEFLVDNCSPNPCANGDCLNYSQGYFCKCHPGYTGPNCSQAIDYCSYKNPCVSGVCHNAPDEADVICVCDPGYSGPYCDQPMTDPCDGQCGDDVCLSLLYPEYTCLCTSFDSRPTNNNDPPNCNGTVRYCDFDPCFNGGTCVERGGTQVGYNCSCFPGYNGTNCQVMNDQCSHTNCHHGDCIWSEDTGTYCSCHPGYTGSNCNTPIPCDLDCKYGSCQLNGTVPFCNCTAPYTGPNCNLTTIPCDSSCVHGTCQSKDGGYYCSCSTGYKGDNCEETKDCTDMGWTCQNGGSCTVEINATAVTQHCDCPLGLTGNTCQYYGSRCSLNYCQNGGNCTELGLTIVCVCPDGFSGEQCEFSKSKSFNLLWTEYASTQQFVSPQRNTTLYREFTLCGWVQYAPPTAVKSDTILPPFMGIITSNNPSVLNVDNQGLMINGYRIMTVAITALQWHHICIRSPSDTVDIKDKPIWNYFLDGVLVANATESPLPQNNYALYMVSLAPPSSTEKFQGEISMVQLYYTLLDDRDIASLAYECSSTTLNPRPLVDWDNFTSVDRGNPGVMQLQPGICDLSNCLPGRQTSACNGLRDKIPPVVLTCPSNIRILSFEQTTQITWDTPTFQDNVGVDHVTNNFRPGESFPWGYYQVIYVAYDAAGNTAVCQFAIMVAPDNCTVQDPIGGKVEWKIVNGTNSNLMAKVRCFDEFYPKTDPDFFVCDVLGQWNRISSFSADSPFNFPSCGDTTTAVQNITGTLTANGTCNEVYNKLNSTLAPFCNSTGCFEIVPQCDGGFFGYPRKRSILSDLIQHFDFTLIINNTRQALITPIQQNLSSAFPYDESTASASYTCDPNFPKQNVDEQYVSCVECAAGTEWNETTGECEDCPPDTYRRPPMASCVQCPDNKITGGLSRAPSVLFCYKNCTVGYYYNASLGDCSPAPFGFYQTDTGRTEYISCPLYTSTSRIGETNVEGCNRTCPLGYEFAADRRNCTPCAIGTYKSTEQSGCVPCPEGRSTSVEGAKQMSYCDVLWCPPNSFVGNITYPVDLSLSKYEICPPCPMGTHQPGYNQSSCIACTSLDDAPTCPLSSTCSPSGDTCGNQANCERLTNVTITKMPIYSCSSVTVNPVGSGGGSKTVVIVAVTVSVVVLTIALAIIAWIFRHRLVCCKYIRKRDDVLTMTANDVYRTPRVITRRALTTTTMSSNKSDVNGNGLGSPIEPERPRMLPPPIITSRSALEAMRTPQTPQTPLSIPRVSASTPRSFRQSDEEPVVRDDAEDDEDDDYFG